MRMLLVHADSMRYQIKSPTRIAEPLEKGFTGDEVQEVLVVFTAVESDDEEDPAEIAEKAAAEIVDVARQVKCERVLLYPYAHLSSKLASPRAAVEILKDLESRLSASLQVRRAPFGFYKAFQISCKGHPLSELSRDIRAGGAARTAREAVPEAVQREQKIASRWYVLTPDGVLEEVGKFDFSHHPNLEKFARYEMNKARAADQIPPHVKLMQRLELVDYEPGSDLGNFRWYPKGALVKRLLEMHVTDLVRSQGAMEVETPIMYDMSHPSLSEYLQRFPARQYTLTSDQREFFLRFSACFGQYLMKHDMSISYRNLPLRLYELTHFSFRHEQSGEVVGLKRLRAFTMPDMHTLVADMDGAIQEFIRQYDLCMRWMDAVELDYEVGVRFVKDFYEQNRDIATQLVRRVGKPVLVEMWDERSFYFVMKFEFNYVDALEKASALSTVQIDTENCERFDITYFDKDGQRKYPLMLHASVSGSIDRNLCALLEKAHKDQENSLAPCLPLWLSPTQVRICPVSGDYLGLANQIADRLESSGVRVDVDDRSQSIGKKIRDAEREWVPYIVVVGQREKESGMLSVRLRKPRGMKELAEEELGKEISSKTVAYPKRALGLPRELSRRPTFRG